MRWTSWRSGLVLRLISSLNAASSPSRTASRRSRSETSAQGAGWVRRVKTSSSIFNLDIRTGSGKRLGPHYTAQPMRVLLRGLYQLAAGAALLTAGPFLLARRGSHYLPTLA